MAKIINFSGADYKVGTTMCVQSLAEVLTELLPSDKILVIHLDGNLGTDYTTNHGNNLDSVRTGLISGLTTIEELIGICEVNRNLYSIAGTSSLLDRKTYSPESVEYLFTLLRHEFDYVLVDGGSSVDSGLAVGGLRYSDLNVLITTQQAAAFRAYNQKDSQIFTTFDIKFEWVIVNKFIFSNGNFLYSDSEISKLYDIQNRTLIPISDTGWQAESDSCSILKFKEKAYTQSIHETVRLILNLPDEKEKRRLIFGSFKKAR